MIIRELLNLLSLEVDEASFDEGESRILDVEKALAALAVGGVAAAAAVASLVEHVAQLTRSSQMLGLGTDILQEWGYAAKASGADLDNFAESLLDLEDKMDDASTGGKEYQELFQRLGVEVADSSGKLKSLTTFLPEIADAFANMADGTEKSGIASRLLGETGAKTLLPMFAKGSAGLREMAAEARSLGVVLDEKTVQKTQAFRVELNRTLAVLESLGFGIGGALLPAVQDLLVSLQAWIRENREVIASGFETAMKIFAVAARVVVQAVTPLARLVVFLARDLGLARVAFYLLLVVLMIYTGQAVRSAIASTVAFIASMVAKIAVTRTYTNTLGQTITKLELLSLAEMRAAVTGAAAPYIIAAAWGALVILLGLILEDIYTFFDGGDSVFGRWGEWILGVLGLSPDDTPLVRFLKWLGLLIFDTGTAIDMLGGAIKRLFYGAMGGITSFFQGVEQALQAPAAAITAFFRGLEEALRALFEGRFLDLGELLLSLFPPFGMLVKGIAAVWNGLVEGLASKIVWVQDLALSIVGGVVDAMKALGLVAWDSVKVGAANGMGQVNGAVGSSWGDTTRLVGMSADPARALASSVMSSTSNASSTVFAPSQTVTQTITVGSTAQASEVAEATRRGNESAWEQQLRTAQANLQGG